MTLSEKVLILAHQGGWDEITLVALGPAVLVLIIVVAVKRGASLGADDDDEPPDGAPEARRADQDYGR